VTEESAAEGDAEERGFVRERELVSVREAISALAECSELSSWPINGPDQMSGHEWASTEPRQDMHTGAYESRSVHVARADGTPLTGWQLYRLFKSARLVKK